MRTATALGLSAAGLLLVGLVRRPRCACRRRPSARRDVALDEFAQVRLRCQALREILMPDAAWEQVREHAIAPPDLVHHRSHLLIAYERGHLRKLTKPVHDLLMIHGRARSTLTAQYRADLQERWMLQPDEAARHESFRRFFGKVVELQVAAWLLARGWRIDGLEALGSAADILARPRRGRVQAFETKYIGPSGAEFDLLLRTVRAGRPIADAMSVYAPGNYLVFRVYEAARKLRTFNGSRIAAVVIDAQTWHGFEFPLRNRWINWHDPTFLDFGGERAWEEFLAAQGARYPNLETELGQVVRSLDAIWILRLGDGYELSREYLADPTVAPLAPGR